MVENLILQQGLLSQQDIDEIHKVFVLMDPDGTGQITVNAIRQMAVYVTKDPNISDEEASTLSVYLDTNKDGKVTWQDFLDATCKWLHERSFVRHRQRTDLPSTISEKEALHKGIAELFAMNRVCFEIFQSPSDSLENRAETWDYFGEGKVYNDIEKQTYYHRVYTKTQDQTLFQRLAEQLALTDIDAVFQGLCEIRELLGVMTLFPTSNERYSIAAYLEYVFNHLVANPNIISRVLQCLGADSISRLQWEALKIITLFVPGPRIPALPITHYLHPTQHFTKDIVIKSGILPKIVQLCESPCVEVKDQALLAIGFIARHDPEIRDTVIQHGLMPALMRLLMKASNDLLQFSTTIKAAWTLSILCGATMPREFARPTVSTTELLEISDCLGLLLSNKTDENLLANCLNALSFVLPCLSVNDSTKLLIDRLIYLLGYESIAVKRAALQTTRNIIMLNPAQCQLLIDAKLYSRLNEILMNASASLVKLDACTVLRLLIRQGYTWEIMNSSQLFQQLQLLIDSDPELRWEAVRIINFVLDSRSPMAIE